MGEVLENGVYLPDEGERNAYDGLKGNWNTVDTVVAQVQALSSTGLIRKAVDELPTEDIETNVIYMLKAVKPNNEVYRIEYMYIDNHWDALGTSETTLDDYYTKTETDNLPAVKSGINATKVSNYDTHIADTDIHVTLANKQSWDGKQAALDTNQTAAVNSGITGTKVTGYDSHVSDTDIHVTTSDKAAWNAKQDGLSQTQLAAVNSGVTGAKVTGYDSHVADTDVHVTTSDKTAWNGKQDALTQTQLDNIAAIPDKANAADLATVATTGDYGDLLNAPTIPTVNNASLTIQKNGTDVATFTANASSNVTANLAIPVNTSDLNNDAGFLTQHNPIDNELSATSENALQNKVVKSELDGKAPLVHTHAASDVTSGTFNIARIPNLDASKITSGTIDIARLPKGALERLVKVANQAARYALTTDDVQLGDTVQQLDTGVMYVVTDETKLDSADGYTEFTAGAASSVPWTGVTGKPNDYPPSSHTHTKSQITDFPTLATVATSGEYSDLNNIPASFTPSSHTHGNVTNDGKLGTSSRALISDSSKNITVSSVSDTELGYLSGVTSAIQTQLNGKANDSSVVHKTGNEDISGTKTFKNSSNVDVNIQKGVSSGSCNIRFNDDTGLSRTVIRSYNDQLEIGHLRNANWYDGAEIILKDNGSSKIKSNDGTVSTEVSFNPDSVKPTNSAIDLGTSSNKWKSVYSDSYYLGTTAFGDIATHNASEFSASTHVHGNITNDGKVGTTANKPLITGTGGAVQVGSFGTSANTFCEGNDSRLSDARTPVAHTHTKSDVTDLLNSDFIPSANNSYDLGSSSYQWNKIYSADVVHTSGNETITGVKTLLAYWHLQAKNLKAGEGETYGRTGYSFIYTDKNDVTMGDVTLFKNANAARTFIRIRGGDYYTNGAPAAAGTLVQSALMVGTNVSGKKIIECDSDIVYPTTNNATDLGDSTHKWNNFWANDINSVPTDTVEWHNSHYRGINLISDGHFADMAALLTAIRAQDWSDIYIGDYVELTFTYEGASRTVKFYVGEIDKFYKVGNTSLETHHLVMVTGDLGKNQVMNDSNTTAGGYVGSKAHTVTLPALYAILNPLFNNAILTHREHLSNTVLSAQTVSLSLDDGNGAVTYSCNNFPVYSSGDPNTPGCVTAGSWYDCNLVLMSEIEMFGSNRFASSGIDDIMCPEGQIAAFKYNRNLQTLNRTINTWLRNVNSASRFCYCVDYGHSYRGDATYTNIRLRPRFLIG